MSIAYGCGNLPKRWVEQLPRKTDFSPSRCGNLPKRWVEQPSDRGVEHTFRCGNLPKRWVEQLIVVDYHSNSSSLWKSAKKVGGTAVLVSMFMVLFAVEICQKGGWNSRWRFLCRFFLCCGNLPKRWVEQLTCDHPLFEFSCGNLPKRWVEQHKDCNLFVDSVLWKSAKKVGGTALSTLLTMLDHAVEICQKGGWNSRISLSEYSVLAVEICPKGGWNSFSHFSTPCFLCCGNLPKRWVEQPLAISLSILSLLWKSAKKVGGTANLRSPSV